MRKNQIKLIKDIIKEENINALLLEEKFDDALIGTAIGYGGEKCAAYDSSRCIEILIKKEKLNELEALEQFDLTLTSVHTSKNKPIFISDFRKSKIPNIKGELTDTVQKIASNKSDSCDKKENNNERKI